MRVTASQLRANVYRLLDGVIDTGEALEIERNGVVLRVEAPNDGSWLDRIPAPKEPAIVGDPDELAHIDMTEHLEGPWRR